MTTPTPTGDHFDPSDPLLVAWADQGDARHGSMDPASLVDSVADAHRRDQRRLLWLNVREVVPSLFVAGVFGALAPRSVRPPAALAAALLALGVGCFLAVSSLRHHRADNRWGSSVRDQLARRLAQLEHRAWLYRYVAWWYFLPLGVAIALFWYAAGGGTSPGELAVWGLFAAVLAVLYVRTRRHGRSRYESEAERLRSVLAEFDQAI